MRRRGFLGLLAGLPVMVALKGKAEDALKPWGIVQTPIPNGGYALIRYSDSTITVLDPIVIGSGTGASTKLYVTREMRA